MSAQGGGILCCLRLIQHRREYAWKARRAISSLMLHIICIQGLPKTSFGTAINVLCYSTAPMAAREQKSFTSCEACSVTSINVVNVDAFSHDRAHSNWSCMHALQWSLGQVLSVLGSCCWCCETNKAAAPCTMVNTISARCIFGFLKYTSFYMIRIKVYVLTSTYPQPYVCIRHH